MLNKNTLSYQTISNMMKSLLFSVGIFTILFSVMSLTMVYGIPLPGLPVGENSFNLLDMTASGKNVYLVYDDDDLFFAKSSNEGFDFEKPTMINDPNTKFLRVAKIAITDDDLFISWNGKSDKSSSNQQVLFRKSTDSGNTFASPIVISKKGTDSLLSQLIAVKDHIYVTMMNTYHTDDGKIYANVSFRASSDNGETFGEIINLLPGAMEGAALPPPVQIQATNDDAGKTIYVIGEYSPNCPTISAGCTNQIFFAKSTDFGATFSAPEIIYSTEQYIWELHTRVVGENVYLVWGEKSRDINFMKSDDGGETFSLPVNLTGDILTGISVYPNGIGLTANESNVYVVWGYLDDGKAHLDDYILSISDNNTPELFLIRSIDDGNTFSQSINISGNSGGGYATFDIKTSNNFVYVTWSDYKSNGKSDIHFKKSSDTGANFDQAINLSSNLSGPSSMPLLSTVGNNVYVSWQMESPHDILFKVSNDNGNNFANLTHLNPDNTLNNLILTEIKEQQIINTRQILSPLKQFQSGIAIKDIKCANDLVLIQKLNSNQPACVKPETKTKLIERGWASS